MQHNITKLEALAIVDTYEGMLRPLVVQGKPLPRDLVERRAHWLAVAAKAGA